MINYGETKKSSYEATALKYILTLPTDFSKEEKLPLIIFLHGAGERGEDVQRLKAYAIPKLYCNDCDYNGTRVITLSPLCPDLITWYDLKKEVFSLIESVCSEYNVDRENISLCGISMGGFGTWEIAMTRPDMFSKIAPICGGGVNWRASQLKMPIRVFHGALDDVVPIAMSEIMVNAVLASGGNVEFTVYDDLSHNCWDRAFEETDLIRWLASPKK